MSGGTGRPGHTSYAFMNAAGYGHDWSPTMHPVRTEVREYLDSILTDDYKNEIRQYYHYGNSIRN